MKHQHHRHASTSSSNVLSKDYYPLHRSVTDDHEERQIKHHDKKSPLTRFVTKLLGLPVSHHHHRHHRHHHHHGSHRRGKSNSTTSITLSSVFHFHHHEKQPPQEPSSADDSCSSVSSDASDDLGTVNSSTVMSSTATHHQPLDSFLLADSQPSTPTLETRGLATDSPLASPAMDALVNASQLPARQSTIQFVTSDFDHLAPIQLAHPSTHVLLTPSLAEQLRPYLPRRYRLSSTWQLAYSLDQHGASLSTLYSKAAATGPCILLLRDNDGQVFGAFLNESIQTHLSYYGTGECFLWKLNRHQLMPASQSHHHPPPKIKVYPWTGKNEYLIYSTIDCIALGGGHGKFGLWLNQDLEKGHSEPCATFDNDCLSLHPHFTCLDLEIWSLVH